jgi:Arm DNA-binding domain
VTLADLVGSKGFVELTDRLNGVPVPLIADVCKGQSFTWPPADEYWHAAMSDVEAEPGVQERRAARTAALVKDAQAQMAAALTLDVKERSGLTEQRLAKRLGVTDTRLAHVSLQLWHGTFRKNAIAAPGLTPPSRRRVVSRASCARNSRKHSPTATVEKYQTQSGATLYMVRDRTPGRGQTKKRGFKTKRDAEWWANKTEVEKLRGEYIPPSLGRITVGELAPDWLASKKQAIAPSHYRTLESAWRVHVEPRWAGVSIADVDVLGRRGVDRRHGPKGQRRDNGAARLRGAVGHPGVGGEGQAACRQPGQGRGEPAA